MGKRALSIGLFLLSIALSVGPILVGLSAHGWDFKAAVTPSYNPMKELSEQQPEMSIGNLGVLRFDNVIPFDPSHHYVHSWEEAESKLVNDLGYVIGHVDLGNAGAYEGHAPFYDCAGCFIPDNDTADPGKDCVSPNDGTAPVFEFNVPPGPLTAPLPMDVPRMIIEHDPVNAIVVRSSIESIRAAFVDANWEFYYPCEGFFCPEPHTPMGEIADAFLSVGEHQYHVRIFYGGYDDTYGNWYYMGAHYEGQNARPIVGATVNLTNPYNFPLKMENVDLKISCSADGQDLGKGWLDEEVVIPLGSSGTFDIVVEFTVDGFNHLSSNHLILGVTPTINTSFDLRGTVQVKIYELAITVPLNFSGMQFSMEVGG
jgi:LEA14-like dessication related protein